jgi:ribonuclease R
LGEGGQEMLPLGALKLIGQHISQTERTAAQMEREVMDRYLVLYLEDYVGRTFKATIVGVTAAGVFFALEGSGAQGFMHKSRLPGDYFVHDEENHRYIGTRTKRSYQLGNELIVILDSADARTSATLFSLPESANEKPKKSRDLDKIDRKKDDRKKTKYKRGPKDTLKKPVKKKGKVHKNKSKTAKSKK